MLHLLEVTISIVAVSNFILGIVILSRGWRDKINLLFALTVLSVVLWSIGILGFYLIKLSDPFSSFWILLTHFSAALLALIFLYFSINFPVTLIKNKFVLILPLIPFVIISFFIFLTTNIIGTVFDHKYVINSGYIFYAVYLILYFFIGHLILFWQYYKTSDSTQKIQIKFVLVGALASCTLATITDLIFPYLNIFQYTWLGPLFTSLLVASITYAILRHHLFNIRVIATELFTAAIWIILLIKTLLSSNLQDFGINLILFISFVIFGLLLVRSVIKEVRQREQMEQMAKEIQEAYEKEKKAYEMEKAAREELESLDKAKNQFLLAIQHHLRTPLTAMMGYSDLLLGGSYGKQNKQTIEIIKRFQVSTDKLIKMVNEFLDITQFQLGKEVISLSQKVEVSPILTDIITDLTREAEVKKIFVKLEKPAKEYFIKADVTKLKAALFNVFDNAVKYTQKGGVTIKAGQKADKLVIEVKDTGIGMSQENLKKLFTKTFERGEEAKRAFVTGRGIGMYISSQIIKAHKGKIWAESEGPGKGSTFFVELPLEK